MLDLLQRGVRQVQGVDYDETLSRVAMLKSVGIMLAVAASFDYEICRWMSKHCFIDDFLEDRLYVIQPEGLVDPKDANKYVSSSYPSMDWSKCLGVGIYALMT